MDQLKLKPLMELLLDIIEDIKKVRKLLLIVLRVFLPGQEGYGTEED